MNEQKTYDTWFSEFSKLYQNFLRMAPEKVDPYYKELFDQGLTPEQAIDIISDDIF